jgi:hypothetical protein
MRWTWPAFGTVLAAWLVAVWFRIDTYSERDPPALLEPAIYALTVLALALFAAALVRTIRLHAASRAPR